MNLIQNRWARKPDEIMNCTESSVGKKSFWTGEHFLEFSLAERTAVIRYKLQQFSDILMPKQTPYRLRGDFVLYFVFQGPFLLPFNFHHLPIRDGKTNCSLNLECRIEDRDLEYFRHVCAGREVLRLSDLANELYDPVRASVVSIIKGYSYSELTTGQAQERRALLNKLIQDFGTEFVKKGLSLVGIQSVTYENKEKENLEKIIQEQEAIRISQRYREMVNAQKMSETSTEAEMQKQAEEIAQESFKRKLIHENEIETLKSELTAEQQKRELAARKLLELEEHRHRMEMAEIEAEHNRKLSERSRQDELDHLKKQLEIQRRDIDKKYEVYTHIHKMIESLDAKKIADVESALTRVCYNLETLPKQFAVGIQETLEQSYEKFRHTMDRMITERLSGSAWEAIQSLFDSVFKMEKPFKVEIWTEQKGQILTSAEVRPGDVFECFIRSNRPGWLFLIDHGTSGKITKLVPNQFVSDNKIEAEKIYSVYDFLPTDDPEARFLFQEDTKPGIERVQALVTLNSVNIGELIPGMEDVKLLTADAQNFDVIPAEAYAGGMRSIVIGRKKAASIDEVTFASELIEFKILS